MKKKHFRVTLDFEVLVKDMTKEKIKDDLKHYSNYAEIIQDADTWEMADRQKRLLQAIVNNEDILNRILTKLIVERWLESSSHGEFHSHFDVDEDEEQILEPVIATLNEGDVEFFREQLKKVCSRKIQNMHGIDFKIS